jgi:4-hydroxy-3-methylbut-2-en-1-yl diphosphate synthase IspG/GcpE
VDLIPLANEVEAHFQKLGKPITVAVMGCVVNGPGESRDADIGLAAGKGKGAIFRKGEVVRIVPEEQFLSALIEEGRQVLAERFPDESGPPPADDLDAIIPMTVVDSATRPGRAARR